MTVCFPPLIKPDGRFSRIRLSGFHLRGARLEPSVLQLMESIVPEEHGVRPALVHARDVTMFAPQPTPQPLGDEVIHLPEAAGMLAHGEVVAPATGDGVNFPDEAVRGFPRGPAPGHLAEVIA